MPKHDLPLCCQSYLLPRNGHSAAELEDAVAADVEAGRFAVADGASESAFAAEWARILTEMFVATPGRWSRWLPDARHRWLTAFRDRDFPWYLEEKFERGAFATLLGVSIAPRHQWMALSVGDGCLFQVRRDRLLRAFPLRHSSDFSNRPALVGSRPPTARAGRTRRCWTRGRWQPDDRLLMMTDALAQWFLRQVEAGGKPWQAVDGLGGEAGFAAWLNDQRQRGEVRNDDAALLVVRAGVMELPE